MESRQTVVDLGYEGALDVLQSILTVVTATPQALTRGRPHRESGHSADNFHTASSTADGSVARPSRPERS